MVDETVSPLPPRQAQVVRMAAQVQPVLVHTAVRPVAHIPGIPVVHTRVPADKAAAIVPAAQEHSFLVQAQ